MVGTSQMSMEQINQIAQTEKTQNIPILQAGVQFWTAAAEALAKNHRTLGEASHRVAEHWRDTTHATAFEAPVEAGLASMAKSVQTIMQANPQEAAQNAISQIEASAGRIAELFEQYLVLQSLAEGLASAVAADPLGHAAQMLAHLEQKMREIEAEARLELKKIGQEGYSQATPPVRAAGANHAWNGSQSVSAVSTASVDGAGVASSSLSWSADAASGEDPQWAREPDASDPAFTVGPAGDTSSTAGTAELTSSTAGTAGPTSSTADPAGDTSETGLAGGATTAPTPPVAHVPPAGAPPAGPATPGVAAPLGAPLAGGVGRAASRGIPVVPTVAGLGAKGASTGRITQAAAMPGGIASASSGKAPSLPPEPSGAGSGSSVRKPGMVGPTGAGVGVPTMLAPLTTGGVQGLINRLKPLVNRVGFPRVEEPESVPGVPRGLRGRTAHTDDEAFRPAPRTTSRSQRSTTTDAAPETVQLLDEEIWQVEQARAGTGAVPVRR